MVPEGWSESLLDNVTTRRSGHTPNKKIREYWNGGVKWVSLADSSKLDDGYIHSTDKEISSDGLKNSSAVLLPKGSVILSRDAGVGKSAILGSEMAVSQHFIAWVCEGQNQLHNWFLYYWMQTNKQYFERMAVGSTIKTIGLPLFRKIKIVYPPLPEQRKIADILSTWDRAIEVSEALLATARRQKRALMQSLLTGKRRFPAFEGQPWKEVRLGDVADITKGKQKSKSALIEGGEFPVINGGITPSGFTNEWNSEADTITISEGGNSCGFVNRIPTKFWSGGHCYTLKNLSVEKDFLFHALKFYEGEIMRLRVGSGLPNIQKKAVSKFTFSAPNTQEQKTISAVLSAALGEEECHQKSIAHLRTEKKALMQQLLTGKRRVVV